MYYQTPRSDREKYKGEMQVKQTSVKLEEETSQKILKAISNQLGNAGAIDWGRIAEVANVSVLLVLQWVKDNGSAYHRIPIISSDPMRWRQQQLGNMQSFIRNHFDSTIDWAVVSLYMGIKVIDCASAYSRVKSANSGIQAYSRWTSEENEKLKAAVAKYPPGSTVSWVEVAKEVGSGRTSNSCRERIETVRRKEAKKTAVWTEEELETIERAICNAAKGEHVIDELCQLIPSKSKDQIQVKATVVRERERRKMALKFSQEDKEMLASLVDRQMSSLSSTYSTLSAVERAKYASDHHDSINWQEIGMKLGKRPSNCRLVYGLLLRTVVSSTLWTVKEIERLYRAIALFKDSEVDWNTVSAMVGSRSNKQCNNKFINDTTRDKNK